MSILRPQITGLVPARKVPKEHRAAYKETVRRAVAAAKECKQRWHANSSYRSYREQQILWNKYKAGTGALAAKPGTSKHNVGLALDLSIITKNGTKVPVGQSDRRRKIIEKHGLKFGVPGEPWHVER